MKGQGIPVFFAFVPRDGALRLHDRAAFRYHVDTFKGEEVEITLRRKRTQRSIDQNAYLHAHPFPILAEHFGYTIPEVKLVLMGECFGWKEVAGRDMPIKPSTSDMTVEECTYFIDWLLPWAMVNHGVKIALPGEVAA